MVETIQSPHRFAATLDITWQLLEASSLRQGWTRARAHRLGLMHRRVVRGSRLAPVHEWQTDWVCVEMGGTIAVGISTSAPLMVCHTTAVRRSDDGFGGKWPSILERYLTLAQIVALCLDDLAAPVLTATTHSLLHAFPDIRVPHRIVQPVFSAYDLMTATSAATTTNAVALSTLAKPLLDSRSQ